VTCHLGREVACWSGSTRSFHGIIEAAVSITENGGNEKESRQAKQNESRAYIVCKRSEGRARLTSSPALHRTATPVDDIAIGVR
jgi:hypothetical protein